MTVFMVPQKVTRNFNAGSWLLISRSLRRSLFLSLQETLFFAYDFPKSLRTVALQTFSIIQTTFFTRKTTNFPGLVFFVGG